jgi:uncharacterized membrane-anchored protein
MPPQFGQEVMVIDVDWRQPFIDYIREQKVPSDKNTAEQLARRAKTYVLVGDKLYRRGATSGVLMKCIPRDEGKDILEEIRKGVCDNLFEKLSTSPQLWLMLKNSSESAKDANSSPSSNTSRPTS